MNSNDVYAISGRIKNMISMEDLWLSPAGNILANAYTLVLKDLHDFAEKLPDPYNQQLADLLFRNENLPLRVIALTTPKKGDEDG